MSGKPTLGEIELRKLFRAGDLHPAASGVRLHAVMLAFNVSAEVIEAESLGKVRPIALSLQGKAVPSSGVIYFFRDRFDIPYDFIPEGAYWLLSPRNIDLIVPEMLKLSR